MDGGIRRGTDVLKALALGHGPCWSAAPLSGAWPCGRAGRQRAFWSCCERRSRLGLTLLGCPPRLTSRPRT